MTAAKRFKASFSKDNLIRIYSERIAGSGAIGIDRVRASSYSERLNDEISLISSRANSGNYKFTAYKEKLISKGAHSNPRQISIPTVRDRIALRALCECLNDIYPECRLKLPHVVIDSLKIALASGIYTEYAKIDLQNFYPSIPHKLINSSTWKRTRKVELRDLITKAIITPTVPEHRGSAGAVSNNCGVPQGLAISNLLAEIAMQNLDQEFRSNPDIWYERYVDDILILTAKGKAETIALGIMEKLRKFKLSAHPIGPGSKTRISEISDEFSFLGYSISGNSINIRRESILRFESSIAKILTAYKHKHSAAKSATDKQRALAYCKWKINLRITGCIFNGKRLGWVAYFSQITSTAQLRAINGTIDKLMLRFKLSGIFKQKSLIKTYYELKVGENNEHRYIPNFDSLTSAQKRERLAMWIGDRVDRMSDERVDKLLAFKISKAVKDLESDIAHTS